MNGDPVDLTPRERKAVGWQRWSSTLVHSAELPPVGGYFPDILGVPGFALGGLAFVVGVLTIVMSVLAVIRTHYLRGLVGLLAGVIIATAPWWWALPSRRRARRAGSR